MVQLVSLAAPTLSGVAVLFWCALQSPLARTQKLEVFPGKPYNIPKRFGRHFGKAYSVLEETIYTVQNERTFELVRERSRLTAISFRVHSSEESRERLKEAIERFPQATHYDYAFRLGSQGEREFASDGGEPKGSAGWPILGALRRFMVTDTMVVVARYFGGKSSVYEGLLRRMGMQP